MFYINQEVYNGIHKKRRKFKSTTPEQSNDMGNGWSKGAKDFKQLWQDAEDIDFEIIEPKQLPESKS